MLGSVAMLDNNSTNTNFVIVTSFSMVVISSWLLLKINFKKASNVVSLRFLTSISSLGKLMLCRTKHKIAICVKAMIVFIITYVPL